MKRKCVVVLAILVLMQVLCGAQSAPKAQTAGEKKPTILVESKNFFKNNPITEIYEYLYGECRWSLSRYRAMEPSAKQR